MDRGSFKTIESHMLLCMQDAAHDKDHVYRVLFAALELAGAEASPLDSDVLIASCLLHDIGRSAQFQNPTLCHALVGGEMAYEYLLSLGWPQAKCAHVRDCITTHRYRSDLHPATREAQILFDADKLDVTGPIGIARTLFYLGQTGGALYSLDGDGLPLDGSAPGEGPSFCHEYRHKLQGLAEQFYTPRAHSLAAEHYRAAEAYYQSLIHEVYDGYRRGTTALADFLQS